ncbi:hypothetical protein T459_15332 [Capsicum annuum]|uniref:NB-ARC domain-containing protein n=1 Tax=Capsicum annuum TaxID=4072 RepID=A0A2G2ZJX9_CAPAN|nr:hypothetical protein FXO37_23359 [Capsicum annuum]PHT82317.1 hypothetical protein T459_15332 [Capsicum annuum]
MDAETSFSPIAPPVFNGDNYQVWAVRMETYLDSLDLWEVVEEDYNVPTLPNNPTMAQIKAHKEKKKKNNVRLVEEFKKKMLQVFEMTDLGLMTYFLGMEIKQSCNEIFICQKKYAREILKKFHMENCKVTSTPMNPKEKLSKEDGTDRVDEGNFRSLIGCLMYLTTTRPDIPFVVSFAVLREDIVNLRDFIKRLKIEEDQTVLETDQIEQLKLELTFLSACLQICYYISDGSNAEMSCISYEVHDLVRSLFHQSGDDMLVKLKDHVVPRLLESIKRSVISNHQSESSATMTEDELIDFLDVLLVNLHYLPKVRAELIFPSMTQYELLQNVFGNLRDFLGLKVNGCIEHKAIEYVVPQFQLMAERVGHFCFSLLAFHLDESDEDETNEDVSLLWNYIMMKKRRIKELNMNLKRKTLMKINSMLVHLLLKIIPVSLEVFHKFENFKHMVNSITPSNSARNIHLMIEFLLVILSDVPKDVILHDKYFILMERVGALTKEEDLKNVFLKAPEEPSQLCYPLTLLLRNLNDFLNSNAYSVVLIKEEIHRVKKDLEDIRDHGLFQLIFLLPDTMEKITQVKKEVLRRKQGEVDVISIVGMPGFGKTTLAYRVYNQKSVVGHFDVRAWCTVDQERNEKKLLQKIFNQVIGLKESFNEDGIDKDVADKLRKHLFGKRPEESWELLEKRVFGEERCPDELRDVGEKIARKCDGLPLLSKGQRYCDLFVKDLWSDERLVEPTDLKSVDEVMEVYVDELISSSLVIVRGGRKQRCQIHELVHEFCSIKARTDKLFDLTSSIILSSSSSSDLMLRSRTIIIDEDPHSDDSSLFSPEKRNPYVKHLLSLQHDYQWRILRFPNNGHLRHLRLLKRHACSFEVLKYSDEGRSSPSVVFKPLQSRNSGGGGQWIKPAIDKPVKLENLLSLKRPKLSSSVDSEDIFKWFPNLQRLKFFMFCWRGKQIYFPRLDVLNKREKVKAELLCCGPKHVHQFDFHFPSSLKEVELDGFDLTSDSLSRIGTSLPNLKNLVLYRATIEGGKEWNMEQLTFHNLKSLTLNWVSFCEWKVIADESFPVLEDLEIIYCNELIEIPDSFGDIASLKSIVVRRSFQLKESAFKIKEYVEKMTGEDKLDILFGYLFISLFVLGTIAIEPEACTSQTMDNNVTNVILAYLDTISRDMAMVNERLDRMVGPREKVGCLDIPQDEDYGSCEIQGKIANS